MPNETYEPRETKEVSRPEDGEQESLSPAGQRAMQGVSEAPADNVSQSSISLEPGDWNLPPNVKPSKIRVRERPDDKISIVYGTERNDSGRIVGDHGHTVVRKDGEIDYARTISGDERKDTGE